MHPFLRPHVGALDGLKEMAVYTLNMCIYIYIHTCVYIYIHIIIHILLAPMLNKYTHNFQ